MKTRNTVVLLGLAGILLLSAGCSQREMMLKQGYPPAYADGWDDGYQSGKAAAALIGYTHKKDTYRFQDDPQYAQGWTDGFTHAKGRADSWR